MENEHIGSGRSHGSYTLNLSVKQVFVAGLVTGLVATLALGFLVSLKKGGSLFAGFDDKKGTTVVAPSAPTAPGAPAAPAVGDVRPVTKDDHVRGDKNAPITMIEYSDYECPFCSRFHPTMKQALEEYKGKVNWVFRHFPLSQIHPNAQKAAEAAECASEQGKFWEMTDKMFEKQAVGLALSQLRGYAGESGVKDLNKFDDCLSSGKYAARVQSDQQGGDEAGVTGTPGTIILGKDGQSQLVPGALPYESVKAIIDSMLQ
jgi:protein-disulfide isomerase